MSEESRFLPERFGVVPGASLGRAELRRMLRHGELRRTSRGVYLTTTSTPATPSDSWKHRAAGLLVAAGPDGKLSRQAAAAVWGLDGFEVGAVPVECSVPRNQRPRLPGVYRPSTTEGSVIVDGLPVTPLCTTLLELGVDLMARWATAQQVQLLTPEDLVELALESALRNGRCSLQEVREVLGTVGRTHRGRAVLARVLARRPPDAPATGSYLETRTVQVFRNARLPDLDRQVTVRDVDGAFIGIVDFLRGRGIVEVDGHLTHDERPVEDRRRWTALTAAGFELAVFTFEDVEHAPGLTCRQARRILALAGSI